MRAVRMSMTRHWSGAPPAEPSTMAQLSDDCFAFGGSLLGIDAARTMIFERVTPVAGIEKVPLRQALGRTLAEDIAPPIAVPRYDNSALPGYSVPFHDLDPVRPTPLRC